VRGSVEVRFFAKIKIDEQSGCWVWVGALSSNGYGSFRAIPAIAEAAHRVSYRLRHGALPPKGFDLDHLCRNRACVNPDHLEVVTRSVNLNRGIKRNLLKTQCPSVHAYSGENLRVHPTGGRACKACNAAAVKRYRERKVACEK